MGQQKGALKIKGTLGDITFAKTKNGYIVKTKSEISKDKLDHAKEFEKFRHNKSEFARCGIAVKLVRDAFKDLVAYGKDSTLSQRMQKLMMEAAKTDPVSERGMRSPEKGNIHLLQGFEFNARAEWNRSIRVSFLTALDRVTGKFSLTLPGFTPQQVVTPPEGSNRFRIVCACSEVDIAAHTQKTVMVQTGLLPIDSTALAPTVIQDSVTPNSDKLLFLVVGIQFAQEMNGFEYPDTGGEFNVLTLETVDNP